MHRCDQKCVLLDPGGHGRCSGLWNAPQVRLDLSHYLRIPLISTSVENSQLSKPDKRLWKRIWWTLFTRDRSVAVALGRPIGINTDDSDVEMVTEDDFIEDELDTPAEYRLTQSTSNSSSSMSSCVRSWVWFSRSNTRWPRNHGA